MQLLSNGCRIGKISVHPENWETTNKITCDWYISYRFYDNAQKDKFPKGRQVFIKGMNDCSSAKERREITKAFIKDELDKLMNHGYNPITKTLKKNDDLGLSNSNLLVIDALELAKKSVKIDHKTLENVSCTMRFFYKSLINLGYDKLSVKEIKRSHIRAAIDNQEQFKKVWSANQFNVTKKYLSILFSELVELEIIDYNPVRDIKKRKHIKKLRSVLSEEEKQIINTKLKEVDYHLWLFAKIFFHSGARITEFCRLQLKDINLKNQTVKFTVLKGRQPIQLEKPIKNVAVKYWKEWIADCANLEYYFLGTDLKPAPTPCRFERVTKRWKKTAKNKLEIECDFYELKHTNTDEISALAGIANAMRLNSHTNLKTTEIYAVNEKQRQNEILKTIDNDF